MLHWLIHWALSAGALLLTAWLVPGFHVLGFGSALIAAAVVGIANSLIRPILFLLTLPLTILTLGLFSFVLSAIILRVCAALLDGFNIDGWLPAILGAVVLAIVSSLIDLLIP